MKKTLKTFVTMLVLIMVTMLVPVTASAATPKTITVTTSGAKISKNALSLAANKTSYITVKYGGKKIAPTKVAYKSSNTGVATVSKAGTITAKKAGKTTITIRYKKIIKKLTLTVTKPAATTKPTASKKKTITVATSGAKITKNALSLTATGTSTITVKYGGKKVTATKVAYKSSKTSVATVSKKGVITAKKPGKTTITVKYKGITKKLTLTVTKPGIAVKLGTSKVSGNKANLQKGKKAKLTLTLGYKNSGAKKAAYRNIPQNKMKWKSSKPSVAIVSKNGVVTAKKTGKTTITMTYGSVSQKITLTVTKGQTSETGKHTHKWTEKEKHTVHYDAKYQLTHYEAGQTIKRWIIDKNGWTEKVKIGEEYHCTCGINFGSGQAGWDAYEAHSDEKVLNGESGHSYGVVPIYDTIYHEPEGHWETVTITEPTDEYVLVTNSYDEIKTTYECIICDDTQTETKVVETPDQNQPPE